MKKLYHFFRNITNVTFLTGKTGKEKIRKSNLPSAFCFQHSAFCILLSAFCFLFSAFSLSAQITNFDYEWTLLDGSGGLVPYPSYSGVTASNVTLGGGFTYNYNGSGLDIPGSSIPTTIISGDDALANGYYLQFTITPNSSAQFLSISSLSVNIYSPTGSGTTVLQVYYSLDNWATKNNYGYLTQITSSRNAPLTFNAAVHEKGLPVSFRICFYRPNTSTQNRQITFSFLQSKGSAFIPTEYEIWNWADLAYLNVLCDNTGSGNSPNLFNYSKFKLMQDLGIPGQPDTYGDGTTGCTYGGNRQLGCYGYQNWISGTFDPNADYSSNTLVVGPNAVNLGRPAWNYTHNGWTPIGGPYYPFRGVEFDGQGHTIDGLWCEATGTNVHSSFVGLFGDVRIHNSYFDDLTTTLAIIKNLHVNIAEKGMKSPFTDEPICDMQLGEAYCIGGIVASFISPPGKEASIINCSVTGGEISGTSTCNVFAGGVVGKSNLVNIENCYTTNDINVYSNKMGAAGGLVGRIQSGGHITDCYATGNVSVSGESWNNGWELDNSAGGLIGYVGNSNWGNTPSLSEDGITTIERSYATGSVFGNCMSGGLIGQFNAFSQNIRHNIIHVDQCYATGDVTGGRAIGGLAGLFADRPVGTNDPTVGNNNEDNTITNCYATGNVYGIFSDRTPDGLASAYQYNPMPNTLLAGGLIGSVRNGAPTWSSVLNISNCFATGEVHTDISLTGSYAGGVIGYLYSPTSTPSSISKCFAYNPKVTGNNPGRVMGFATAGLNTLANNGANPCMEVWKNTLQKPLDPTPDASNEHGMDILWERATTADSALYTTTPFLWNFAPNTGAWTFDYTNYNVVDGIVVKTNLPILQAFDKTSNNGFFADALQYPYLEYCGCPTTELDVCTGDEVVLLDLLKYFNPKPSDGAVITFYDDKGTTPVLLDDPSVDNPSIVVDAAYTPYIILVKIVYDGCEDEARIFLNVHELPDAPLSEFSCEGEDAPSITVTEPIGNKYEYSLDGGEFQPEITFYNVTEGTHTITVKDIDNECITEGDPFEVECECVDEPKITLSGSTVPGCVGVAVVVNGNSFENATSVTISHDGAGSLTPANGSSFTTNPFGISYTPAAGDTEVTITVTTDDPVPPCEADVKTLVITVNPDNTVTNSKPDRELCINTDLEETDDGNIIITTTGATGISGNSVSQGLPPGVTANFDTGTGTITISGTPTVANTYNYTIPLTGGCGTVNAEGVITVNPDNTVTNPIPDRELCINTNLEDTDDGNIIITTTGATGISGNQSSQGLPPGVTATFNSGTITISGTPTSDGEFSYSIPLTGGCGGTINAEGVITVNALPTVSVLPTTACYPGTPPTLSPSGAGWISNNTSVATVNPTTGVITLTGTGQVTFTYTDPATECTATTGTLTVNAAPQTPTYDYECDGQNSATITVTAPLSGGGTTYEYSLNSDPAQTGTTFSGLTNGNYTITVTNTTTGCFTTGNSLNINCSCVNPPSISLSKLSDSGCAGYSIRVEGNEFFNADSITITHDGAGVLYPIVKIKDSPFYFDYTPLLGVDEGKTITITITTDNPVAPCEAAVATFEITVNPNNTVTGFHPDRVVCIDSLLTTSFGDYLGNIVFTTTGITGIDHFDGLPDGLLPVFAGDANAGTITISGTPTEVWAYQPYTIYLTGGNCGPKTATGNIWVWPANTITPDFNGPDRTVCINMDIEDWADINAPIYFNTTGVDGVSEFESDWLSYGLPPGVWVVYGSDRVKIYGTPTEAGVFHYKVRLTGGCGPVYAEGTITVIPEKAVTNLLPNRELCINTDLEDTEDGNIIITTTGATGISGNSVSQGLPPGVTANFNTETGTITISGIPTEDGEFSYSITLIGDCGNPVNATGKITVNAAPPPLDFTVTCSYIEPREINTIVINSPLGSYQYRLDEGTWQTGTTFGSLSGHITYTVSVQNDDGCILTKDAFCGDCATEDEAAITLTSPKTDSECYSVGSYTVTGTLTNATSLTVQKNGTGTATAVSVSGGGAFSYEYEFDAGDEGNTITLVFTAPATDPNCPPAKETVTLTINRIPTVDISKYKVCMYESPTLTPLTTTGEWVSNNTNVATVNQNGVISFKGIYGTVTFTYTNSTTHCTATTAELEVFESPDTPVATAFCDASGYITQVKITNPLGSNYEYSIDYVHWYSNPIIDIPTPEFLDYTVYVRDIVTECESDALVECSTCDFEVKLIIDPTTEEVCYDTHSYTIEGSVVNAISLTVQKNGKGAKIPVAIDAFNNFSYTYTFTSADKGKMVTLTFTANSDDPEICESKDLPVYITINPKPIVKWRGDCDQPGPTE